MEDTLKRFIYSGVGLLSFTSNKIKGMVEELVKDRKISEEEGKRIMDELLSKSKEQRQEFEEQFRSFSSKFNKATGSPEEEIEKLRRRVEVLEKRLNISKEKETGSAAAEDPVEKVERNERVSLGDEVLTPEKKMQAEQNRMQQEEGSSTGREETDTQKTSLGGPILSPEKKVEEDSKENRKE